jgi:long-subunit acyl-CoA synthetase (AMP-forming)
MPMLTHMNLICGLEGQRFLGFNFNERDSYLSYVPLTHVQEQLLHVSAITFGFKIGYSSNDI